MSKSLSCLLLLLHFLSPWDTVLLCACDRQKHHGKADNSTPVSELERGKKRGSPVHVLVTEPLGSFREDVKWLLPAPADQPPNEHTAFFWKRCPHCTLIHIWRCMTALMAAVYPHICHSIHIKTIAVKYAGISQIWKVFYKPISYADSSVIALKCY